MKQCLQRTFISDHLKPSPECRELLLDGFVQQEVCIQLHKLL